MKTDRSTITLAVMVALLAGIVFWQAGGVDRLVATVRPSVVAPVLKVTAATYHFDEQAGGVPSAVTKGIGKLNDLGIVATTYPSANVPVTPTQYEVSLPAARAAGLPAFVVMAGDKVVRVVKAPKTEAEILEAAK